MIIPDNSMRFKENVENRQNKSISAVSKGLREWDSFGSDTGIRTRVSAVRGRRPGPLDDIAKPKYTANAAYNSQYFIFP